VSFLIGLCQADAGAEIRPLDLMNLNLTDASLLAKHPQMRTAIHRAYRPGTPE